MESAGPSRRLFIGAEAQARGGVHFRVWAPRCQQVEVVVDCQPPDGGQLSQVSQSLKAEPGGFFSTYAERAKAGDLYRFRLDGDIQLYPDPASRFQPQGSAGPSQVVDPSLYAWRDQGWRGVQLHGQVVYELHVGTFTNAGTWQAAARELEELAGFGITLVEVMPLAEFPGRFGWGYDGVDLFAPTRLYGSPDDFRAFVDRAHELGMGVILDVVYNHFGPADNYLGKFSDDFVSRRHVTEWGSAVNFDGENCGPVREFFCSNAAYWIDEYHLDGLRLDAIHAIEDDSEEHIVAALTRRAREQAAGRSILVIAENEHQEANVIREIEEGGYGLDATWNDDFHHAVRVASTGHNDFFYGDYRGTPQELLSAVQRGFLYQGQWNRRQGKRRGSPTWGLPAERFVTFLENHDQVAHSGRGERPHRLTSPGRFRAVTALWLLAPGTPMFFQGQEFWASAPFMFFADHNAELAALVRKGRHDFLKNFYSLTGRDSETTMADPGDIETFNRCKLDFSEREKHSETYLMHRELLRLRREDPVFASQRSDRVEGAVWGAEALLLRYRGEIDDRLVVVNLGCTFDCDPASEPLLAPPDGDEWQLLWSSEDPRFGGAGTGLADEKQWRAPGHAALVFRSAQAG